MAAIVSQTACSEELTGRLFSDQLDAQKTDAIGQVAGDPKTIDYTLYNYGKLIQGVSNSL